MNSTFRLRILVENPPSGVAVAVQSGKGTAGRPHDSQKTSGDVMFEVSIEVKSPFSFGGPFVQKDGKGQFIYLCWGLMAGDTQSRWQRRTKIYLHALTEDRVSQALATGEQLTLAIQGTGKDGGPACATVPVRLKA